MVHGRGGLSYQELQPNKGDAMLRIEQLDVGAETLVSGTLVDLGGTVWSNALVIITFSPTPSTPGPYMWGDEIVNLRVEITTSNNGYFVVALPDNSSITPSGSTWHFVISPNATMPAVIFQLQALGETMDISSIFTNHSYQLVNQDVKSLVLPRAYDNSSVPAASNAGQIFYDTTEHTIKLWTGSDWISLLNQGSAGIEWETLPDYTDLDTFDYAPFGCYYISIGAVNKPDNCSPNGVSIVAIGNIVFLFSFYNPTPNIFFRANINNAPGSPVRWSPWAQLFPSVNNISLTPVNPNSMNIAGMYSIIAGYSSNIPAGIDNTVYSLLEVFVIRDPYAGGIGAIVQRAIFPVSSNPNSWYTRSFNTNTNTWTPWTI